ncbi:hypothetical protein BRDID11002_28420 [Bradyrhizobium diazoefficiens]
MAAYGGGELHPVTPGPFIVSYGVVEPDQTIHVVIRWDHRVTDAAPHRPDPDPAGTGP